MHSIQGFTIEHRLYRSPRSVVYRARRSWDGTPVILKCASSRFPSPTDLARLRRNHDFLVYLDGRGAPRLICQETQEQGIILVIEDFGCRPLTDLLERGPLSPQNFVSIALACCDTLETIHSLGVLHKDLSPSNILLDNRKILLIDFSSASKSGTDTESDANNTVIGTPAYISPEQTGRIRRPVDQRSDYYSLGATFYELLTGRPPFQGEDTLDLLLAHVGRSPEPPHVRNQRVPEYLSRVILKLLSKSPEERYQSLSGLRHDLLLCKQHLESGQAHPPFPLGQNDHSEVFRLSQKLYERDDETALFDRLTVTPSDGQKSSYLLLFKGNSGVGKTALCAELANLHQSRFGPVIMGRFEEFRRSTPYAAIIEAVSHYLRSLLSNSEEDLSALGAKLERALAGQGAVLSGIFPDLEVIMGGPQPSVPQLSPVETENRFLTAFRAMMITITQSALPLVMIFDDLQWADRSSLHLLQTLLSPINRNQSVILVGTGRADLPETTEGLSFFLDRLSAQKIDIQTHALQPLSEQGVTLWLAESLALDEATVTPLAVVCHQKTSGNPFFISRFIYSLVDKKLIAYDYAAQRWTWSLTDISQLDMTDNVIDLMVTKLSSLTPVCNRTLQRASCIGQTFDLYTLSQINDVGPQATLRQLDEAVRKGLITSLDDDYQPLLPREEQDSTLEDDRLTPQRTAAMSFRFLHGRIHQAAYSFIPPGERGLRHLNIGRTLLEQTRPEDLSERLFAIVNQLNRGIAFLRDPATQLRVAELNLQASRKARSSGASADSLSYAQLGLACLGDQGWALKYSLCLALHNEAIEAAQRLGENNVLLTLGKQVLTACNNPLDRSLAYEAIVLYNIQCNDTGQALHLCLKHFKDLGFSFPSKPSLFQQKMASLRASLIYRRIRQGQNIKKRSPTAEISAALRLFRIAMPSLFSSAPSIFPLATAKLMAIAEVYGDNPTLVYALSQYAGLLASQHKVYHAIDLTSLTESLLPRQKTIGQTYTHIVPLNVFAEHWKIPLADLSYDLKQALNASLGIHDPTQLAYLGTAYLALAFHAGKELPHLTTEIDTVLGTPVIHEYQWLQPYALCLRQMIENLQTPCADPTALSGGHLDEMAIRQALLSGQNYLILNCCLTLKLFACCIFEKYDEAKAIYALIDEHKQATIGTPIGPFVAFLYGLIAARDPAFGSDKERCKALSQMIRYLAKGGVARFPNSWHRWMLLRAELTRLRKQTLQASELYDKAIKGAHSQGFIHEEAICNEMAARFHQERSRSSIAEAYRKQAHYAWRLWGATTKVAQLEENWPSLVYTQDPSSQSLLNGPGHTNQQGVDFAAAMKAAQAISGEIQRPALLERLMHITISTAGAERGMLFLKTQDKWALEAEGTSGSNQITLHRPPLPLSEQSDLSPLTPTAQGYSRKAFNVATRTLDPLVVPEANQDPSLANDPYIQENGTRSLLCLPLFQQADLRGLLYLENNLTPGAFTKDTLEVLRLLAAQVIISLDNATLYEDLSKLNRTLEAEVLLRTHEATEKKHLLETTLDHMSDGLVVYDSQDRLLLWNRRATNLFGLKEKQIKSFKTQKDLARSAADSGALSPRVATLVQRRLEAKEPPFPDRATSEIELADGRIVQMRRTFLPDGGQVHVFMDVTEERQREQEVKSARIAAEKALKDLTDAHASLIQAEKMASLGQLVAGVAHEINTPIGVTLTAASFLAERAQDFRRALQGAGIRRSQLDQFIDQAAETTDMMVHNIQRASDLIQSFKQVAVDQSSDEWRQLNVEKYFSEVLRSLGPALKKTPHSITLNCAPDLTIESHPGTLSQILSNLVMNSVNHAFPGGQAGHIQIDISTLPSTAMVEVRFSDDGIGIPENLHAAIFEPFFTTRRSAGGSGLGLNIVYNLILKSLGGTIDLQSTPGEGTTFVMRFPPHKPDDSNTKARSPISLPHSSSQLLH